MVVLCDHHPRYGSKHAYEAKFGWLGCPWWVEKRFPSSFNVFGAKYKAPLVFVDISRDEGDAVCVICNILDSLYVPALMSHARGVCYSLSCLYELKLASVSPRVRSGPSMIMPLIVWRIIDDSLTVYDDVALAIGHI